MAGIIAHLYVANQLYGEESQNLFPKAKTRERKRLKQFFLAGALAPDIGHFPGGDVFVSSLSHYVRTSTLVEQLLQLASNDEERAFAYGWIAHVYEDVLVHPFINRKVAKNIPNFDANAYDLFKFNPKLEHMRLEFGYDLELIKEYHELKKLKLEFPHWEPGKSTSILQRAYLATYGYVLTDKQMLKSRKSIRRGTKSILYYYSFLNWLSRKFFWTKVANALLQILFFIPLYTIFAVFRQPALMAMVTPKAHTIADFTEYEELLKQVKMTYRVGVAHDFSDLKDYNLDTGKVLEYGTNKHADATLKKWASFLQNLNLTKLSRRKSHKHSKSKLKKYLRAVYKKRVTKRKIRFSFKHS